MSEFETGVIALTVSLAIGFTVAAVLLSAHLITLFKLGWHNDEFHIRKLLLLCTCLLLVADSTVSAMVFVDWRGREDQCHLLPSFAALFVIMVKQFQIIFLYTRAKVVHSALRLSDRRLVMLRWGIFSAATVGVVCVFYPLQFVFISGQVNQDTGVCYMYTTSPVEIVVFATSDVVLSAAMLAMFYIPLNNHARSMLRQQASSSRNVIAVASSDGNKAIHAVARKNIIGSTLSIGTSFAAVLVFAVILATTPLGIPETEHLFLWALFAPGNESYISLVILHLLTNAWMPPRFKETRRKLQSVASPQMLVGSKLGFSSRFVSQQDAGASAVTAAASRPSDLKV